jgi:hypothetical protein
VDEMRIRTGGSKHWSEFRKMLLSAVGAADSRLQGCREPGSGIVLRVTTATAGSGMR